MNKFCSKCGAEIPQGMNFCNKCGNPVSNNVNNNKKGNKILYAIIIIICIFIVGAVFMKIKSDLDYESELFTKGVESNDRYYSSFSSKSKSKTEEYLESLGGKDKAKENVIPFNYESLARTPNKYKLKSIHIIGKVVQVIENNDEVYLRVNTKLSEYDFAENDYVDDTMMLIIEDYNKNDRILENDYIDAFIISNGLYDYTSVLGNKITIPSGYIFEYTLNQ